MSKQRVRGFTLVELLAVVAIVGILAVIGVPSLRKLLNAAKEESEAKRMLPAIGLAQAAHGGEALVYLSCSSSPTDNYPRATPDTKSAAWSQPLHPDQQCWQLLGTQADSSVYCVYSVVAGAAGETPQAIPKAGAVLGVQSNPWYLAVAACDVGGDGDQTIFWTSSATGVVAEAK